MKARFVVTQTGHAIHISDNGQLTRCGFPAIEDADADDVIWFWPPCQKCAPQ